MRRYVALLLALAMLLAGITFARYYGTGGVDTDQPLARYDVTYTVDGINSTSFGNMNYWQLYGGRWAEQGNGNARTVRLTAVNNSDVAVNPKLRLTAPAEFWDNIALQVFDTVEGSTVAMGDPLTTQFVLADLLYTRGAGETGYAPTGSEQETHNYSYNEGYRTWTTNETYNTATSDAFGQTGAVQCGFCIPGMVLCAKALIAENPDPTPEDVKKAIRGNICRCTGYVRIAQIDKIRPLDDPAVFQVETGNDPLCIHQSRPPSPAIAAKLRSSSMPTAPLFSGWNWQARRLSFCTAASIVTPYDAVAVTMSSSAFR